MVRQFIALSFILVLKLAAADKPPNILFFVDDWGRYAGIYSEVQAADAMPGVMLAELDAAGELDGTLVILSGDNGIPGTPRGKTSCHDLSVSKPMLVRLPEGIPAGRRVDDFVSVKDIDPTLLELAGVQVSPEMDGRSFQRQPTSKASSWIDPQRASVVFGRGLHFHSARDSNLPDPMRAIRSKEHLYIQNFKPDHRPSDAPYHLAVSATARDCEKLEDGPYHDLDTSLTKEWLLERHTDPVAGATIKFALGIGPEGELYAIETDPNTLRNLAGDVAPSTVQVEISKKLIAIQENTNDPRLMDIFDKPPYVIPPGDLNGSPQTTGKKTKS